MISKTLLSAAALALVLPVTAHANDAEVNSAPQEQQRQMERTQYQSDRAEVRDRLRDETSSVAESNDTAIDGNDGEPSSLNSAAPASGTANTTPLSSGTGGYNE